jgi:SlyX protein
MSEERFIDLETRLAHQDNLLHELNDVVSRQQTKIMQLEALCQSLIARVCSIGEALPDAGGNDEGPPHY